LRGVLCRSNHPQYLSLRGVLCRSNLPRSYRGLLRRKTTLLAMTLVGTRDVDLSLFFMQTSLSSSRLFCSLSLRGRTLPKQTPPWPIIARPHFAEQSPQATGLLRRKTPPRNDTFGTRMLITFFYTNSLPQLGTSATSLRAFIAKQTLLVFPGY
jgi:hypothetical protein